MFHEGLEYALELAFTGTPDGTREMPFFASLPDSAIAAGYSAWWDADQLCQLTEWLPAERVPVVEYSFVLDVRWRPGAESMRQAVAGGPSSPAWRRVMGTDEECPIILGRRPDRWTVLDGWHRLQKAELLGHLTIPAILVRREQLATVLLDGPFFGDLNRLWLDGHELLLGATRRVAQRVSRAEEPTKARGVRPGWPPAEPGRRRAAVS